MKNDNGEESKVKWKNKNEDYEYKRDELDKANTKKRSGQARQDKIIIERKTQN